MKIRFAARLLVLSSIISTTVHAGCITGDGSPTECDWTVKLGTITAVPVQACLPAKPAEGIPNPVCWELTPTSGGPFSLETLYNSSHAGIKYINFTTFTGTYDPAGVAKLKYTILGIDYAPPGAKSTVSYADSNVRGTSITTSKSFTNAASVSTSGDGNFNLFGILFGSGTGTASASYTTESDSSSSVGVQTTTNDGDIIPGPSSSALGVDHDADIIWVWLNPQIPYTVVGPAGSANSILQGNYQTNPQDPVGEMDIVAMPVAWLKNPSLIPSDVAKILARSWDTSGTGGLTTADYATILSLDPFAGGASYNPNTDSTHRYDLQAGYVFNYEPAPQGSNPITETFSVAAQNTSSQGQGASVSYSVGASFSADVELNIWVAAFTANVKTSDTITNTSKWSSTTNTSSTKTASLSITGPAYSDHYTGPVQIQVWRDNVYGSFMFYPVN
jgi:hypothetical protein